MSETITTPYTVVDPTLSVVSRVYCGLSKPDGGKVTDSDLESFIDDSVCNAFPDGFTVLRNKGGWRDIVTGHTIREDNAIIEIAHGSQDKSRVIDLAREWKERFKQQAVMVISTPVATQFV